MRRFIHYCNYTSEGWISYVLLMGQLGGGTQRMPMTGNHGQVCLSVQRRYNHMAAAALETYTPPDWAAALTYKPQHKIRLAVCDTPIHPWKVPGVPADFTVCVKRDDLTGSTLSGNKVRKLEFLMADCLKQGCSHVITCGGLQSNHCRAVVLTARQLGLTPHVFLRTDVTDTRDAGCAGNVLLDRICGAHMYLIPKNTRYLTHIRPRMETLAQRIKATTGEASYLIPVGGSNKIGLFGYLSVFEELRQQGVLQQFDDLVFPCGSGGTAAGLVIGNFLTGQHLRLHAITVSDNAAYFCDHIQQTMSEVGLGHLNSEDLVRVVEGYMGPGYGIATPQGLDFIKQVATDTGVILDPVYSGKGALGMVQEMNTNAEAFKGRRVLYLHTGGIFGLMDGRMTPFLEQKEKENPLMKMWPENDDCPV